MNAPEWSIIMTVTETGGGVTEGLVGEGNGMEEDDGPEG